MTSPTARVREGYQPVPPRSVERTGKRGYQPRQPLSPRALANPPRGGSNIRPPAARPNK